MKNKQLHFCLCGVMICAAPVAFAQKDFYIPKALIMPFHDQPQQLYLSAGYGGGYDVNASYSLSSHIALFVTGTFDEGARKRVSFPFGSHYRIVKDDRALSYGAGYFKTRKGKLNIFETYAGYGAYRVDNYWYFTDRRDLGDNVTQAKYTNVFWQANLGRKTATYEYGFAARLSYFNYQNMLFYDTYPNTAYEKSGYKNLKGINAEPVVCFGYRIRNFSINAQAGISAPLTSSRHTILNTFTTFFNNEPQVTITEGTETDILFYAFARLSLQCDLNMGRKKTR